KDAERVAGAMGLQLSSLEIQHPETFDRAFEAALLAKIDAFVAVEDYLTSRHPHGGSGARGRAPVRARSDSLSVAVRARRRFRRAGRSRRQPLLRDPGRPAALLNGA